MIMRSLIPTVLLAALALVGCGSADAPSAVASRPTSTGAPGEEVDDTGPVDWPTYLPDGQPDIEGLWHYVGGFPWP